MFDTEIRNPLYWLSYGINDIAFTLAAILAGVVVVSLWKGYIKHSRAAAGAALIALVIGVDLTRVYNTTPVSITVHPDTSIMTLGDGDSYESLLMAHPSHLTILGAMLLVVASGGLAIWAIKGRRLLTSGMMIVGFTACVTMTFSTIAYQFNDMTSGRIVFRDAEGVTFDLLFVGLCGFILLAGTVGTIRGIRRIKRRAQVEAIAGAGSVREPAL